MKQFENLGTEYFINGEKPSLLILSGTHGDEADIIPFVKEQLNIIGKQLPDFLFIPAVSPSAVSQKTRLNKDGKDLNRTFKENSTDREVTAIMEIIKEDKFKLCISFHEDPERTDFYLYDSGDLRGTSFWERFKAELSGIGVGLMNGIDDNQDVALGYEFSDGYSSLRPEQNGKYKKDGTFWSWAMNLGIVDRFMNPEIPGNISLQKKKEIVKIFFEQIIIPLLGV